MMLSLLYNQRMIERFLKSTSATAMVILRGDKISARAGSLSVSGFKAFTEALIRYWSGFAKSEINRYVVLPLDDQFSLVFAKKKLTHNDLLGLRFPMGTPLARIRKDMTALLHLIQAFESNQSLGDDRLEQSLQLTGQSTQTPDSAPAGWYVDINTPGQLEDQIVPEEPTFQPGNHLNHNRGEQTLSSSNPFGFDHHFDADHQGVAYGHADDLPWHPLDALIRPGLDPEPDDQRHPKPVEDTWQPLDDLPSKGDDLVSILQEDFEVNRVTHSPDVGDSTSHLTTEKPIQMSESDTWDGEVTQPVSHKTEGPPLAETVLDTTFYLVPRADDQYLLGELAHRLRKWLPKLCQIYGWQLEFLSVRPDYLKWTLGDFPECLTQEMLAVVKRWTSTRIYKVFPGLQGGNPSPDFWSSGYLVDTQNRDFPTQVLIAHVSRGRSQVDSIVL